MHQIQRVRYMYLCVCARACVGDLFRCDVSTASPKENPKVVSVQFARHVQYSIARLNKGKKKKKKNNANMFGMYSPRPRRRPFNNIVRGTIAYKNTIIYFFRTRHLI